MTPSLTIKDAPTAIEFYIKAFGARENLRLDGPPGIIMHAEISIGNSVVMLSSEFPDMGVVAPEAGQGGLFMIYVEDCEKVYQQAIDAGAASTQEPMDQFWGDRTARVNDPFGYRWTIAQRVKEINPEEMEAAAQAWIASQG